MLPEFHTSRLVVRPFRHSDADDLWRRRNDPDAARYQDWETPYARERAESIVADLVSGEAMNDGWWMGVVEDASTGETIGDLVAQFTWKGKTAEIGYTLWPRFWGRGYALEAAERMVAILFQDLGVTRVFGMLHPDNPASAMVLERLGMLFEGHTRSSFWVGGEVSDDHIYGMTRDHWEAWVNRPRTAPEEVGLIEVTVDNFEHVAKLATHKTQERFVAPMLWSFTDALFPEVVDGAQVVPWMRAVEADGELVGFVMLALASDHHPEPSLWRLLIDRMHQRRGIGTRVLDLVSKKCRETGASTLLTSWGEGKGSPRPFYERSGFVPTGRIVDDETEARMHLG